MNTEELVAGISEQNGQGTVAIRIIRGGADEGRKDGSHGLTRRRIDGKEYLELAREEEAERKAENDREIRTRGLVHLLGRGRMTFGKADRVYNPARLGEIQDDCFCCTFILPVYSARNLRGRT